MRGNLTVLLLVCVCVCVCVRASLIKVRLAPVAMAYGHTTLNTRDQSDSVQVCEQEVSREQRAAECWTRLHVLGTEKVVLCLFNSPYTHSHTHNENYVTDTRTHVHTMRTL